MNNVYDQFGSFLEGQPSYELMNLLGYVKDQFENTYPFVRKKIIE